LAGIGSRSVKPTAPSWPLLAAAILYSMTSPSSIAPPLRSVNVLAWSIFGA
jgi:hypothetical protein